MDNLLENHISKHYFPESSRALLGNKKFHLVIRNRNPDYNFNLDAHSQYGLPPKRHFGSVPTHPETQLNQFSLRHQINFGHLSLSNRYQPFQKNHIVNSVIYKTNKLGVFQLIQNAERERTVDGLILKHKYTTNALKSRSDFVYSASGNFDFSSLFVYKFEPLTFKNKFLNGLNQTTGVSFNVHLNSIKLRALDLFYHLQIQRHQFLLAHLSRDPTVDNFLGKFIVGYIKTHNENAKTIVKMVHDYQDKDTEIELVRESRLNEKSLILFKITSGYHIGTALTYHINDRLRMSHFAGVNLRKFFEMQENYKFGIKLEMDL